MTMSNKKNVPEIRFKGFTEEWKFADLENLVEIFSGLTYSPTSVRNEGTLVLRSSNVKDGKIVDADNVYVASKFVNSDYVACGDVIVVVRNGSRSLIGKHAMVDQAMNNTVIGAFMTGLRYKQPEFLNALLDTKQFDSEIAKNLGATINQITNGAFKSMSFTIPQGIGEQKAIGNYFQGIDKLIVSSQAKLDKLKTIKKACLEKMFPRNGSNIPEIRFKGFAEEWKEMIIGSIANDFYGGGTPRTSIEKYWDGVIPWIQTSDLKDGQVFGIVPQKYISDIGIKESATKLVPENSIAIITRVGVGKLSLIPFKYATSQDFLSLSKLKIDEYFAAYTIHKKMQIILKEVQGTSIKGITKDELLAKKIEIPIKKGEQKTIGKFFINLDELIAKTEQKIEKLKNIKKACLDKMFVNTED